MDFLKRAMDALGKNQKNSLNPENNQLGEGLADIKYQSDQPEDETKLCTYIKGFVDEVRNTGSRTAHEGIWMTNYAYMLGFDGVYYDTGARQYRPVNGNSFGGLRRDRVHCNKILPTVQRRQARLCKNRPKYEIRPDSATEKARAQARLELNLLEYYHDKNQLDAKRLLMTTGLQQCGHYFMKVRWDGCAGRRMKSPTGEYEYEGDLKIDLVSPFEVFVDPIATTLEDAQKMCQAKVRKLEYFRKTYKRGYLVKEENAWLLSAQYEMRIQSMVSGGPGQTGIQTAEKDTAIELAYYERPTKKYPNGRLCITANGVLLHDDELPVGEFPFVKFDDISIAGKFYPEAIVTHLRPIQDQYNRTISKRARWLNILLAGKYLAARGAGMSQEAMTDQSGEIVWYDVVPNAPNGGAPMAMNIPVIPAYAYTEEDKLNQMFYDIAGDSDISRGILPAAGIPAIGMQLLLEQDETRIGATTEQHEHAIAELGRIELKYLEKFALTERLMKISDPNSQYDVVKWDGSMLKSEHDVIVIRGSLAPASRATNRNDIMNLYQAGLLGDPNDPAVKSKTLERLEFGDTSDIWNERALDEQQINKTIKQIEAEIIPEVNEADNHVLHYKKKNDYRKSEKFDLMTERAQAILEANMEEHMAYLQKLTSPQFGLPVEDEAGAEDAAGQMEGQTRTEAELNDRLDSQMEAEGIEGVPIDDPNANPEVNSEMITEG